MKEIRGKVKYRGPLYLGHGTWQRRQGSGPEEATEAGRGAAPAETEGAASSSDFAANALDSEVPCSLKSKPRKFLASCLGGTVLLVVLADVARKKLVYFFLLLTVVLSSRAS